MKNIPYALEIFKVKLANHLISHDADPESVENLLESSILIADQVISIVEVKVAQMKAEEAKEKAKNSPVNKSE